MEIVNILGFLLTDFHRRKVGVALYRGSMHRGLTLNTFCGKNNTDLLWQLLAPAVML
jgi:hypothetical protein